MTQVKEMTNQQLNRALAVALGCQVEEHSGTVFFFTIHPNGQRMYHQLPDYAGDVAASLEVQTAAIAKDSTNYFYHLFTIKEVIFYSGPEHGYMAIATATPRERAEAAYLTLGGE